MFDANQDNEDAVARLVSHLRGKQPGEVVDHKDLVRLTGIGRGTAYYYLVMRARRRLRDDHGIWSEPVKGVGYMLQTPQASLTKEQKRRMKRARRQIGIGEKAAASLPDDQLTPNQRRLKEAAVNSAKQLRKSLAYREAREAEVAQPLRVHGVRRLELASPSPT